MTSLLPGLAILVFLVVCIVKVCTRPSGQRGGWIAGLIISLLLIVSVGFFAVKHFGSLMAEMRGGGAWTTVKSKSGTVELSVPASWKPLVELAVHDPDIGLGNERSGQFCMVITQAKDLTGVNLAQVDEATAADVKAKGLRSEAPVKVKVNGMPGIERRLTGIVQGFDAVYLRVVIESATQYHYVSFWGAKSNEARDTEVFRKVVASFRADYAQPEKVMPPAPVVDAAERVYAIVSDQIGVTRDKLTTESKIADLGDELDSVELVMAVEEEFGIEVNDEASEAMATVGDLIKFVEKNARALPAVPDVPESLPANALLRPRFHGGPGEEFEAGSAFLCQAQPDEVLLLTAHHLFGESGGLEKNLGWDEVAANYPSCTATVQGAETAVAATQFLPVPGALGMTGEKTSLDLAAWKSAPQEGVTVLPLARAPMKIGDVVYLNSLHDGWIPAQVVTAKPEMLAYRFFKRGVRLQATSGAPVVNAKGEVVALNTGGMSGTVVVGIGNPAASIRTLLTKARKKQKS